MPTKILLTIFTALLTLSQAQEPNFNIPGITSTSNSDEPNSTAKLTADHHTIAPGQTFRVAITLTHPAGWHSYYINPGGIEKPLEVKWNLPQGFTLGNSQLSTPHISEPAFQLNPEKPNKSYTYSNSNHILITEITAPTDLTEKSITINANATWQICKDSCLDQKAELTLTLPISNEKKSNPQFDPSIQGKFPTPSTDITAELNSSTSPPAITIKGAADIKDAYFISDHPWIFPSPKQTLTKNSNNYTLTLETQKEDIIGNSITQPEKSGGILILTDSTGTKNIILGTASLEKPSPTPTPPQGFLKVFLLMFLGGMILNLMPCVFPVIGIKILGFVQQAGQDRKKIILHGLLYTAGVVLSFFIISGILFLARNASGGNEVSWGYQLQDRRIVLALLIIMFTLAMNMYGVFEIGTSATSIGGKLQTRSGLTGTFFSGILATIVATPCSAPFLASAMSTAISFPAVPFFASFLCMALGLCAPYLLLSMNPKLVDFLPRPGPWMESLKQSMSFLLFATAGYLLWVYGSQIKYENLLNPIFGISLLAIGLWIYGRWFTPYASRRTRSISLLCTAIFSITGIYYSYNIKGLDWKEWSESAVQENLNAGKPVYVDFTATWCLTCQQNKKVAYTDHIAKLIKDRGIVTLKADKTNPNPAIDAALKKLNKASIPVNVLYIPGKEPIITPVLLTPDIVEKLITENIPEKK